MKKRIIALLLVAMLLVSSLMSCSNNESTNNGNNIANANNVEATDEVETPEVVVPAYETLDPNVEGEITVMLWSGDGSYLEDVGRKEFLPEEIAGQNQAATIGVAKEFNKLYPNVKINIFAKAGSDNDENGTWTQHRENFKAEHGRYPDLFASNDLAGDISRGLVADLSIFSDDPMYQSFNPSVMAMMNFNGFQAGLPQYLLPWGVYVNKSLAEDNNLDVPEPNWTIDEYTDFIAQADMVDFYGAMDTPFRLINTGSTNVNASLFSNPTSDYVQLDSEEQMVLVDYIAEWVDYTVYGQNEIGNIDPAVMDENWWWGYKFFIENKLLTNENDPWMMGDAAHPAEDHWGRVKATDWDIYPRPSTDYQDNTVGVVLDPFAVYNYAMDDGNSELSAEEEAKMKLSYTFAAFWTGDTRSWQGRADSMFLDGETFKTSLNDSFPFVQGEEFQNQLDVWYSVENHQRFKDEAAMPGFHEVLKLWEAGQFWDVSDKSYPWFHDFEGTRRSNLYEWENMWNVDVAGAIRSDANWSDNVKARLVEWDDLADARFEESFKALEAGLKEFYGK